MTRNEYEARRIAAGMSSCAAKAETDAVQTAGIAYKDAMNLINAIDDLLPLLCRLSVGYL